MAKYISNTDNFIEEFVPYYVLMHPIENIYKEDGWNLATARRLFTLDWDRFCALKSCPCQLIYLDESISMVTVYTKSSLTPDLEVEAGYSCLIRRRVPHFRSGASAAPFLTEWSVIAHRAGTCRGTLCPVTLLLHGLPRLMRNPVKGDPLYIICAWVIFAHGARSLRFNESMWYDMPTAVIGKGLPI